MVETREYLERRVSEERQRAEEASEPSAYRAHIELAREYERRLADLSRANGQQQQS